MPRSMLLFLMGGAAFIAAVNSGRAADTCFHVCLKAKMTASDIDDQGIRDLMAQCRDDCDEEAQARLKELGLSDRVEACAPQPLADAELKKIRSGSPSGSLSPTPSPGM